MLKIPRIPVVSSQIKAIGYDAPSLQMDIEFINHSKDPNKPASVYRYSNVSPQEYAALAGAESIGKFFGANIKPFPQRFPFRKLTQEEAAQ